jgi:hypothetical protein
MPGQDLAVAVMAGLAALPDRDARFTEHKYLRSLTAPLTSRGTLAFRHPSLLEKNTTSPWPETMVVDGGVLRITGQNGAPRTVALDAHPALQALTATLSATLAGDLPQLRRLYVVTASGNIGSWHVVLRPRDPVLQKFVSSVGLNGSGADLRGYEIDQANGDRQVVEIQPGT